MLTGVTTGAALEALPSADAPVRRRGRRRGARSGARGAGLRLSLRALAGAVARRRRRAPRPSPGRSRAQPVEQREHRLSPRAARRSLAPRRASRRPRAHRRRGRSPQATRGSRRPSRRPSSWKPRSHVAVARERRRPVAAQRRDAGTDAVHVGLDGPPARTDRAQAGRGCAARGLASFARIAAWPAFGRAYGAFRWLPSRLADPAGRRRGEVARGTSVDSRPQATGRRRDVEVLERLESLARASSTSSVPASPRRTRNSVRARLEQEVGRRCDPRRGSPARARRRSSPSRRSAGCPRPCSRS